MRTETITHPVFGIKVEFVPRAELRRICPQVLPPYWHKVKEDPLVGEDGLAWTYEPPFNKSLKVIVSAEREEDGHIWLHVSVSRWNLRKTIELPDWDDLKVVKDLFIGRDKKALIIMPPESEFVNLNEVHHLWCDLDGDPTPDFTRGTGSI